MGTDDYWPLAEIVSIKETPPKMFYVHYVDCKFFLLFVLIFLTICFCYYSQQTT